MSECQWIVFWFSSLAENLRNERGHTLRCSHYAPSESPDDSPLPCVIYCHGNSGCRADANEAAVVLLPSNITVFTLDFSGSGLSDGDYKNDLKAVLSYLRSNPKVSRIGLWGRSMGAVTSLLYGAEDPSIAGMVLDSAFSNLFNLMLELADVYKIRLPKFTVAPKTFIPALFGHAKDDKFIQPRHSDAIFKSYAGDKTSSSLRIEKYYDLGDVKVGAGMEENVLYEIIAGLRNVGTDAPSSSSAPCSISAMKSVGELLSGIAPVCNDALVIEDAEVHDNGTVLQDKPSGPNEDCCSYTSSNRESWGRCSSLGSDDAPSVDSSSLNNYDQTAIKILATPLRNSQKSTLTSPPEDNKKKKKKNKAPSGPKKPKREKFEKLEALSQRIRHCILKKVNHRRHCSS
ncbi:hypothetical protein Sango_1355000 [Sesamum angolense]|uniref:Serine aminopeptidase S33 domain-containing protein n=1 Tax=Sesamum angolense TaxID=2727404 RepID=A0AAE2BVF8_9LAMI|nr:hypothetical protein Sango_1355000 [Sesamum angolense]